MPFTVKPVSLITQISSHLLQNNLLSLPKYHNISKTCVGKENAPLQSDWLYTRAGSILRKIACNNEDESTKSLDKKDKRRKLTVTALQSKYGCKKDRGTRPGKKVRAYATPIVSIIKDFQKMEWIQADTNLGFVLTEKGQEFINEMVSKSSQE